MLRVLLFLYGMYCLPRRRFVVHFQPEAAICKEGNDEPHKQEQWYKHRYNKAFEFIAQVHKHRYDVA